MGLFDRLEIEAGIDVEFPEIGADPFDITWQSKTIARTGPMMDMYRITRAGRLMMEDVEMETVPEEDRPFYDEEIDGFETPMKESAGMFRKVHQGWIDTEYHGVFEFHKTIDGEYVSLDAKFTDGQLVTITLND